MKIMRKNKSLFNNGIIGKLFGRESNKSKELQVKEGVAEYIANVDRVCEIADGLLMKIELPEKEDDLA
jgi:hypothetical protein